MARSKAWMSAGIRIIFIAVLCLSWNAHQHVHAADQLAPRVEPLFVVDGSDIARASWTHFSAKLDDTLKKMAREFLEQVFENHHREQLDALRKGGNIALTAGEQSWKKLAFRKFQGSIKPLLSDGKKLLVAGNIKTLDLMDISVIKRGTSINVHPKVTGVGFIPSDYPLIQDILVNNAPELAYSSVEFIQPSRSDLDKTAELEKESKEKPKAHDNKNAKAHYYHAEMQILRYFKEEEVSLKRVTIVASKNYCFMCMRYLPKAVQVIIEGRSYKGSSIRWADPKKVDVVHIAVPPPFSEHGGLPVPQIPEKQDAFSNQEMVKEFEEIGSSCSGGGSRRRRSVCNSLKDFTEINADEFHMKIRDLHQDDREKFLRALDEVGMDKLHGSESALKEIDYSYKNWKCSFTKEVMEAVSTGTIMFVILSGGTKSAEIEKTAISPKILSESFNLLQEQELESLAKEYEKFKASEMDDPKSFKGFSSSYKFVNRVNLAMFGKNIIGGFLDGDPVSIIAMGGLFAAGQGLNKVGEVIALKGVKMVEAGNKAVGRTMKVAGPIVGSLSVGISIYSFVEHINELESLKKICQRNDTLFQDRLESNCKFDTDIAIANTVADGVGIVSGVATAVIEILELFSVGTGPAGLVIAAIEGLVAIVTQIIAAVDTVAKISSTIVGGLTGWEKFKVGLGSFLGMGLPSDIQHLMKVKESYDASVRSAVEILSKTDQIRTYIAPTTHKIKVNCRLESRKGFFNPASGGYMDFKPVEKCDFMQEFEDHNEADFQNWQQLNQFKVEPDTPSWGQLECKPNSLAGQKYETDPDYCGITHGYLCHNVIAMSAPDRSDLPVLVDLKNGTDQFLGFRDRKHVFLVDQGIKRFTGGRDDDIFVMNSFPFYGHFDGAEGDNTMVLAADQPVNISINMSSSTCFTIRILGFIPFWCLTVNNIQQIIGRSNKSDSVVVACSTSYVDLNGGESASNMDQITIPSSACKTSPVFKLRQFTKVENNHQGTGEFVYQVAFAQDIEAKLNPKKNSHHFVFSNDIINSHLSLESETFVISNKEKTFKTNFIKSENFTLVTQAGLSIRFDEDTKSFYGTAMPSNGTEQVSGFVNYPNRFILATNQSLKITGGKKDDIFSFTGTSTPSGSIDGNFGEDSIIIQQDFHPNKIVSIDFDTKNLFPGGIHLSNIENVIGRRAMFEDVVVTCAAKWLDLGGGTAIERDVIRISSQASCVLGMTIIVRNFTKVENLAATGDFNYRIDLEDSIQTNMIAVGREGNATHNYIFLRNSSSVSEIAFNATSGLFKIRFQNESWSGVLRGERSTVYLADQVAVEVLPNVHGVLQVQSNSTMGTTGLQSYPNVFDLGTAPEGSYCTGGQKDDSFFVSSETFYGDLIAGDGNNLIILMDGIWKGTPMIIDGIYGIVSVQKENQTECQFEFNGIQRFIGRLGESDVVFASCDTTLIDTRGGWNGSSIYDVIHISS